MKRGDYMFMAMILIMLLIVLTILVIAAIVFGGVAFIVVFGDVIVCIFILIWLIRKILKRK